MTKSESDRERALEVAADWLLRLEGAPDDPEVQAAFEAWLGDGAANRDAWRSVERMWAVSARLPANYAENATARPGAMGLRRSVPRIWIGAAAALAACLAVVFWSALTIQLEADYVTGTGEIGRVALSDGTIVHLDADSAIAVRYEPRRRGVRLLAGRAFFEVARNREKPFVVSADGVRTTVTGTAFAVGRSVDEVAIALQHGAVSVAVEPADTAGQGGAAKLFPGDRVVVDRRTGRLVRTAVPVADIASWRTGRLVVHGTPLAKLVDELSRYHRGAIVLRDDVLGARRITGSFDLRRPAEALEAAVRAQGGTVTRLTPWLLVVNGR